MMSNLKLTASLFAMAVVSFAGAAYAADLYTPPPPAQVYAPESAFSWTGVYLGGALGWSSSQADLSFSNLACSVCSPTNNIASNGATYDLSGFLAQGTIGADYQFNNRFVLGVLADIQWNNASNSQYVTFTSPLPSPSVLGVFPSTLTTTWGYDILARAGFLVTPKTLLYGLGGYSWRNGSFGYTDPNGGGTGIPVSYSYNADAAGWTAGVGGEMLVSRHLSLKAEYRFTDFASAAGVNRVLTGNVITGNVSLPSTEHRFLVGLNWHFN